jgi:purine nucleosidase
MRMVRRLALAFVALVVLAMTSFAIPVPIWRTGELSVPPLPIDEGGPAVTMPKRVWIDTDAACGHGRTTDPDDCFAILLLAQAAGLEIVGISTVFGNAPLDVTDRTTRDLTTVIGQAGVEAPSVHRGSAGPTAEIHGGALAPAHAALRDALADGPLTLVALGPLTNVAAALENRPDLQANVGRLVAVMGRRPGHLFHPAEGKGGGILFGHGPVFRDFNLDMDRAAATSVVTMRLPTTLVPYEAARNLSLKGRDLAGMGAGGGAAAWTAARARDWLDFWAEDVGRDGFYPFDLLAAAYVIEQDLFDCAEATAWVGKDDRLWNLWFYDPPALLVGLQGEMPTDVQASGPVVYCPRIDPGMHDWLMRRLVSDQVGFRHSRHPPFVDGQSFRANAQKPRSMSTRRGSAKPAADSVGSSPSLDCPE